MRIACVRDPENSCVELNQGAIYPVGCKLHILPFQGSARQQNFLVSDILTLDEPLIISSWTGQLGEESQHLWNSFDFLILTHFVLATTGQPPFIPACVQCAHGSAVRDAQPDVYM